MPSVVLQQVSNKFARDNASKTLDKPIALKYVEKYLPPEYFKKIESKCLDGKVYIWGAKAERVHQFGKMPHGQSLVLFRRNATVYKCGCSFSGYTTQFWRSICGVTIMTTKRGA